MKKRISVSVMITLMAITATVTFSLTMVYSLARYNKIIGSSEKSTIIFNKLDEIDDKVRANYIGELDEQDLIDYVAAGYMQGIHDPYSRYLTSEQYQTESAGKQGEKVGIGISAVKDTSGYILVKDVFPGSPALEEGIQDGDLIVSVGGEDVTAIGYEEATSRIIGEEGTSVSLVVRRGVEEQVIEIKRRVYEIPTVHSKMVDDCIGYISISEFNAATVGQFEKQLEYLIEDGAEALIFDMRNNPGGTINSVSSILDMLVPEGDIVSAEYKNGKREVLATSEPDEIDLPMVVITNGYTASAAELFTQCLKDYEKAVSVGTLTFGKGIMQRTYVLEDGSAINLTIAKYFPPKSDNYHKIGIRPDYEVTVSPEMEEALTGLSVESRSAENDVQFAKAVEIAHTFINSAHISQNQE